MIDKFIGIIAGRMISYKHMLAFVEVANASTFADAAKKLYLSQPALSSAIKTMETQLGGNLFIRSTRRVELTAEGKAFLPNVKRVLNDYEGAVNDVKALFTAQQGSLVISAMPSYAEGPLAEIIQQFALKFPNISIRVLDVVMEKTIQNVLDKRAELGFVFAPTQLHGLLFSPLVNDEFCVVVPVEHVLAVNACCTLQDLLPFRFVAMNRESSMRQWLDEAFIRANVNINIVAEATQLGTIGQLVANKVGIAIVPQLCTTQMQNKGLVSIPIRDLCINKAIGAIYRDPKHLSVAAKQFLSLLQVN